MIAPPRGDAFVGRRDSLALLEHEVRLARDGCARKLLLEGDAGAGKSRLLGELADRLGGEATVVSGACEPGFERHYLPFRTILRRIETRARGRLSALGRAGDAEIVDDVAFREAFAGLLAREAIRAPLVCVVEDLQWADPATLALFGYLCRELRTARVLLIGSYRLADAAGERALAATRSAAVRAGATVLRLSGLARNELRGLLQRAAAGRDLSVPPETQAQIEELAEGNPLFAHELLAIALRQGRLRFGRDVPLTARALAAEQLAGLGADERDVLLRAAVVGRAFAPAFLAELLDVPPARLAPVLQRAVAAGLLDADAGAVDDGVRFRHALVQRVLAEDLIGALAGPLHARVARALEARAGAAPAELAAHWAAAGDGARARRHFESAGDAAYRDHAYRDAIRYYTAALGCDYPRGPERAALYERLGTALYLDGCRTASLPRFTRCRAERTALADRPGAVRALLLIADQYWVDARTRESLAAAGEAAQALAGLDAPELAAEAALALARYAITLADRERAAAELRAAERDARTPEQRANAVEIRAEVHGAFGRTAPALRDCTLAARLAARTGNGIQRAQTENTVALVACDLGELAIARRHHRRALAAAQRTATAWRVAYCALNYAGTLTLAGALGQARALVETALETGVDTPTFVTKAASVGIPLALLLGDRALADAFAGERALEAAFASGEPQRIGSVAAACADLHAARGDRITARAIVRRALLALPHLHRCWSLALAAGRHGADEDVLRARLLLARSYGRPRVRRAHRLLLDAYALPAGGGARARHARLAARQFAALGWEPQRALALELAGDAAAARAVYAAIGAATEAPPADLARAGPAPARGLSQRQREIAGLVARGSTNRAIGLRLHISEHTVEHHVSNIFERLGLRSRAELTAFVLTAQRDAPAEHPA